MEIDRDFHRGQFLSAILETHISPITIIPFQVQAPNRYESDLLNEVLCILVGQEAAKISKVKVGGR